MVGVAVKVTDEPEHVGLLPVVIAIVTDGVTVVFTVIVMPVLVAVAGEGQLALLVIEQVITSPLAGV